MGLGTCHGAGVLLGLFQCLQLGELLWISLLDLLGVFSGVISSRLFCWERLILVKDSSIHSAHVSSPRAQVPEQSSQKQQFTQKGKLLLEGDQKSAENHVGLISSSIAPQSTGPSTRVTVPTQQKPLESQLQWEDKAFQISDCRAQLVCLPKAGAGE